MASGAGSGSGGNILWSIVWFLILIFIAFPVAGFCAGWYILLNPFNACCDIKGLTDFLHKGIEFTFTSAKFMMDGKPVGDAF